MVKVRSRVPLRKKLGRRRVVDRYLVAILRYASYWNIWHRIRYRYIHLLRARLGCDIRLRGYCMVQEDLARVYQFLIRSRGDRLAPAVKRAIERNVMRGEGWFFWRYVRTHPLGPKKIVYLNVDVLGPSELLVILGEFIERFKRRLPQDFFDVLKLSIRPPPTSV